MLRGMSGVDSSPSASSTATKNNVALPKEVRLSKVLVNFKPRKLSDFLARCESERAARAARSQPQPQAQARSRFRRRPAEERWLGDVELRPSPSAPPSMVGSEKHKKLARLLPNRMPHRQLLSVAQYNELLSQFTRPPALEQMAKWHSNLRNYDSAAEKSKRSHSSSFQRVPRPAERSDAPRCATHGSTKPHRDCPLVPSATPSSQAARPRSDADSSAQDLKLLAQGIRDLDKSTRMLRNRYSLQVPHSSPSGHVCGQQEGRANANSNAENGTGTRSGAKTLGNAAAATREALKTLAQFARQRGNAIGSFQDHRCEPARASTAQQRLVSLLVADSPPISGDEGHSDSDENSNKVHQPASTDFTKQHCENGEDSMPDALESSLPSTTCEAEARQAAGFEAAIAAGKSGSGRRLRGGNTPLRLPPVWRCELQVDATTAHRYLSGAHFTIAEFLTRHGAAVRTCFEDVRTFEHQVASSTSTGVSLNAIDAQIATRRVQVLRMHYGIAAMALYRDAAALRRQLVQGLLIRRCVMMTAAKVSW